MIIRGALNNISGEQRFFEATVFSYVSMSDVGF